MRMMKNNNNETVMVIGIDHGYGNMKTATRCFPSGVARYDKEPIFQNNLLYPMDSTALKTKSFSPTETPPVEIIIWHSFSAFSTTLTIPSIESLAI